MKNIFFFLFISTFISCKTQSKRYTDTGLNKFQQELNANYKDASKSPLKKKDLKKFRGLDFYAVDSNFIVKAKLTKTPNAEVFKFPTTTNRKPLYKSYGIAEFTIQGTPCKLTIYRAQKPSSDPRYKNSLFLPFTDLTSGNTTYGGGRFMDIYTTDENSDGTITLNFNNTYNPYCAYNEKYSCPITPLENHIDVEVKAGVKLFKKH